MAKATESTVRYRPQGVVLRAFGQSLKDVQIIRGPLGSGKTKAVVFKIIKLLCEQRPNAAGVRQSRVAAIRNTYPDLQTTTIREFKECVSPVMGRLINGHPPMFKLDFMLPDESKVEAEIDFLALDRPDDIRKLRGTQYTFAWLNEVKELDKAVPDMVMGRIDRFPTPGFSTWVGWIGDTNAWDESHWLVKWENQWLNGYMPGYEFFTQPGAVMRSSAEHPESGRSENGTYWRVNPEAENLVVLRKDYYHRQIVGHKDDWIKVNLGNEIGLSLDGKPVHPDYQESVHRAKTVLKPALGIPIYVGMDFGLTPAAAFAQRQPSGQWHVLDEIVFDDGDAVKLADQLKIKCAEIRGEIGVNRNDLESLKFVFRGDPSGDNRSQTDSNTVFQVLRTNGIPALAASTNDASMRRAALDRPLTRMVNGEPGLLVSPKCLEIRKGLAGAFQYKRIKTSGPEKFKDVPDKNFWSHICEALEYALMDAGEHSIADSPAGMKMPSYAVQPRMARTPTGHAWNVFDV
jgi:hypothetical protein